MVAQIRRESIMLDGDPISQTQRVPLAEVLLGHTSKIPVVKRTSHLRVVTDRIRKQSARRYNGVTRVLRELWSLFGVVFIFWALMLGSIVGYIMPTILHHPKVYTSEQSVLLLRWFCVFETMLSVVLLGAFLERYKPRGFQIFVICLAGLFSLWCALMLYHVFSLVIK